MTGQAQASSSSSRSNGSSATYDVFLSFRGDDTRKSFTGHLYHALKREQINVFMDSYKLWEGEEIGTALLNAIQHSKISIPIFSKRYADSKWCLMELVKILECHRSNHQIVLPIFLDVDPHDVRHQIGSFSLPFLRHLTKYELSVVEGWRDALTEVGKLKGWVLSEVENGNESKLVELVVKRTLRETSNYLLSDVKYPIGLESQVNDIISLLNIDSKDVRFIGICGIGGIGKTTIAKAAHNCIIGSFHQNCFLASIREEASKPNGLVALQEKLIYCISKRKVHGEIPSVDRGRKMIKERLQGANVILILDDVDHRSQLSALAIDLNWLGQGSRVIITTRDEKILSVAKVDENKIYRPKELNDDQSQKLFCLHAFEKDEPPEEYMELSRVVANYSGGLPLTLEVLGSFLSDERENDVWEHTIHDLKKFPPTEVYERLKISYDNLENDHQKAIFLDSACFFVGWDKETLISLWEACGYNPKVALHILIKRSLLKFESNFCEHSGLFIECMKMHDQIRDMGRKIVMDESFTKPSNRSRLWSHYDIIEVLGAYKGANLEGLILPSEFSRDVYLDSKHFKEMSNLRFLDISSTNFKGKLLCLPFGLRWLRWKNCPWDIVPTNFCHERLVHLDISGSNIKQAWNAKPQDKDKFQHLKTLNLSECRNFSKSPNFSWFPCLEQLTFKGCRSLENIDDSIGMLSRLKSLNLNQCSSIKQLTKSIGNLKSLAELRLNHLRIVTLPDSIGALDELEVLDVANCNELVWLPRSMRRMWRLQMISLRNTQIYKLPDDFSMLQNLVVLDISLAIPYPGDMISGEVVAVGSCYPLVDTHSRKYSDESQSLVPLKSLSELPSSLVELNCEGRDSLEQLPDLSRLRNLRIICLEGCRVLMDLQGLEGTESLEELNARNCYNMTYSPRKLLGQGTLLPNQLPLQIRFSLIANDGIYKKGLILCIVFEFDIEMDMPNWLLPDVNLHITAYIYHHKDKTIRCYHSVKIEEVNYTSKRDIIYIHHFKGFDWFGIPLQGKDSIEILAIESQIDICRVKFWEVFFEDRELDKQKANDNSNAIVATDFFNWHNVNDVCGVDPLDWRLSSWSRPSSIPGQLEEVEETNDCNGACFDCESDKRSEITLKSSSVAVERSVVPEIVEDISEITLESSSVQVEDAAMWWRRKMMTWMTQG